MKREMKKGDFLPPAFSRGERVGNLTIVKPIEYGSRRGMVKKQWWYECQCSCGAHEDLNQAQLRNGRIDCSECQSMRKSRSARKARQAAPLPSSVPNFATMKLGGSV
jgi:hypothetical protein